jgi:cytochrome P450
MLGPYFVPGETQVSCPTWSIQRDERYFDRPNEWIPERWTSKPEMIKERRAFVPFGMGPMMCVGKHLAMMEMKMFLSKVAMAFDIRFEKGDDGKRLITHAEDYFTMSLPDQTMIFEPREEA